MDKKSLEHSRPMTALFTIVYYTKLENIVVNKSIVADLQ